jgi:hypothetical protein
MTCSRRRDVHVQWPRAAAADPSVRRHALLCEDRRAVERSQAASETVATAVENEPSLMLQTAAALISGDRIQRCSPFAHRLS